MPLLLKHYQNCSHYHCSVAAVFSNFFHTSSQLHPSHAGAMPVSQQCKGTCNQNHNHTQTRNYPITRVVEATAIVTYTSMKPRLLLENTLSGVSASMHHVRLTDVGCPHAPYVYEQQWVMSDGLCTGGSSFCGRRCMACCCSVTLCCLSPPIVALCGRCRCRCRCRGCHPSAKPT